MGLYEKWYDVNNNYMHGYSTARGGRYLVMVGPATHPKWGGGGWGGGGGGGRGWRELGSRLFFANDMGVIPVKPVISVVGGVNKEV